MKEARFNSMKLREWLEALNVLVKANPKILDYPMYIDSDNSYNEVEYTPQTGLYVDSEPKWVFHEEDLDGKQGIVAILLN